VEEMIEGFAVLSPGAMRLPGHKVMIRADSEKVRELQVAVIPGGGSGHEPAHAGYIGAGMLSASGLGAVSLASASKGGARGKENSPAACGRAE
jgi:triose/dihydroxyacetone kinase / FAD-AMP lyase (cyclizing)